MKINIKNKILGSFLLLAGIALIKWSFISWVDTGFAWNPRFSSDGAGLLFIAIGVGLAISGIVTLIFYD